MNTQPDIPVCRPPGRVLVTGATGLLGSNVTASCSPPEPRSSPWPAPLSAPGACPPTSGCASSRATLPASTASPAGCAASTRSSTLRPHWFREFYRPGGNDAAQLQRVNVDAVEGLLEAAADAGVPVMVHISSATTIGTRADGQPSDEGTPPDPGWGRNGYRASKVRAELVIQGWSEADGVRSRSSCPPGCGGPATPPRVPPGGSFSPSPAVTSARCPG